MSNKSNFLAFLLLSISSISFSCDSSTTHLFRIKTEPVRHPRTGEIIPGYLRTEYHRCKSEAEDAAKVVLYSRKDGSIISETVLLYPDKQIGHFLDEFHQKMPFLAVQRNVLVILHYMKTLIPNSEEECRAKLAIFQFLKYQNSPLADILISWEKKRDAAEQLEPKLLKLGESDPKYKKEALKARLTADQYNQTLSIIYRSLGSFRFNSQEESFNAVLQGEELVRRINKPLEETIQAFKLLEEEKQAAEKARELK